MSLSTLFILGLPPEQHGAFQRPLNPANLPHWTLKVAWSDLAWPRTRTIGLKTVKAEESKTDMQPFKSKTVSVPETTCKGRSGIFWMFCFWGWRRQVERKWWRQGLVFTGTHTQPHPRYSLHSYNHNHDSVQECLWQFSFAFRFPNVMKRLLVMDLLNKFTCWTEQSQVCLLKLLKWWLTLSKASNEWKTTVDMI